MKVWPWHTLRRKKSATWNPFCPVFRTLGEKGSQSFFLHVQEPKKVPYITKMILKNLKKGSKNGSKTSKHSFRPTYREPLKVPPVGQPKNLFVLRVHCGQTLDKLYVNYMSQVHAVETWYNKFLDTGKFSLLYQIFCCISSKNNTKQNKYFHCMGLVKLVIIRYQISLYRVSTVFRPHRTVCNWTLSGLCTTDHCRQRARQLWANDLLSLRSTEKQRKDIVAGQRHYKHLPT